MEKLLVEAASLENEMNEIKMEIHERYLKEEAHSKYSEEEYLYACLMHHEAYQNLAKRHTQIMVMHTKNKILVN